MMVAGRTSDVERVLSALDTNLLKANPQQLNKAWSITAPIEKKPEPMITKNSKTLYYQVKPQVSFKGINGLLMSDESSKQLE
jgi:hypothetical protein